MQMHRLRRCCPALERAAAALRHLPWQLRAVSFWAFAWPGVLCLLGHMLVVDC